MFNKKNLLVSDTNINISYKITDNQSSYFNKTKKIITYNSNSDIPLQKIWIGIKLCRVIEVNTNNIIIAFSSNDKTIDLILGIENIISDRLKKDTQQTLEYKTKLLLSDTFFPTIEIGYDSQTVCVEQNGCVNNKITSIKDKNVSMILELDYVQLSTNKLFFNWKIIQSKEYELLNLNKFILDTETPLPIQQNIVLPINNKIDLNPKSIPPAPPAPPIKIVSQSDSKNPIVSVRMVPTKDQLLGALNNLKKSVSEPPPNTDKIPPKPIENNLQIQNQISLLNKVETKEPMTVGEIYKANNFNMTNVMNELKNINVSLKKNKKKKVTKQLI